MTTRENELQIFNRGEKVLCYEPDKSKARVLYDSKVLAVYERKDATNWCYFDYKIHFQGWNSSWDRNVRATSLLKDNEENRKLQRELAEAAQLQKSGGYSYKDTKTPTVPAAKKKRMTRGGVYADELSADPLDIFQAQLPSTPDPELPMQQKKGSLSRDDSGSRSRNNSGSRKNLTETNSEPEPKRSRLTMHSTPKSKGVVNAESHMHMEDRVVLRLSERLREYMEYDYNMITKFEKQHNLPSRMPIVAILENFVKQRAVELAISIKQDSSRARNTQSRNARMEREYDRVMSNVCMLKEVVDGLRLYFEFHLDDLLYQEEKGHVLRYLFVDNMNNSRGTGLNKSYEFINPNGENLRIVQDDDMDDLHATNGVDDAILGDIEFEKQLQKCLFYISKNNNNIAHAYDQRTSPYTAAYKLPMEMRGFLCETFSWSLLSAESPPEKSMVFGAPHLARLLVMLPEYLNDLPISNEKLEDLLPHLESFINYLENHKEWFDKDNYVHPTTWVMANTG
ncbi:protein male-specific lethal-3 [Drosophila grimshawi]|uniref:Protein male-specific lethal-3 n=1 Tax=Drosophila grimshawi TaxID=7222 RepID=B4IZI3_DROGR|nr:protein male-specific lethal-3 [Drosophila grimshawi]EDV97758.1 GH17043 [Drosophila grimshawi]